METLFHHQAQASTMPYEKISSEQDAPGTFISVYDIPTPPSDVSVEDAPSYVSYEDEDNLTTLVRVLKDSTIIPTDLHDLASSIKDRFVRQLGNSSEPDGELPQESLLVFFTDFLDFNVKSLPAWESAERRSRQRLLKAFLDHVERTTLTDNIHTLAARSSDDPERQANIIRSYYAACNASSLTIPKQRSALLESVMSGNSKLYAVLGGQGITTAYLEELRDVYTTYHGYLEDFIDTIGDFLKSLASQSDVCRYYPEGLDIVKWLQFPGTTPDVDYLAASRVSFPIIGILQLAHYMVTLKVLGQNPATFVTNLSGIAGHSQGLVIATVMAGAVSWPSFIDLSHRAVEILFSIGLIGQQVFPETSPDPKVVAESVANDEGVPSSMLSVRGISEAKVQEHVAVSNQYLSQDRQISIALVNGPRNFVVAGPATSLCGLNSRLRRFKVSPDVDQGRIPSKDRKSTITSSFLPISVPFHSKYLLPALPLLKNRLSRIRIPSDSLQVPVYDTNTGEDLSLLSNENILDRIVSLIAIEPVRWLKASKFELATHFLDFGPGGNSGIGMVTSNNKQGTGVRAIIAGALSGNSSDLDYKAQLFSRNQGSIVKSKTWESRFSPSLIRTPDGQVYLDTKMSRLLHMPPIMVAGMTPTTVPWRFVTATINAGYHIELAGGGYRNEADLRAAVKNIVGSIPPGRGVTVNIIYVDPRAVAWQIPLLEKLHDEGVPIDGLTIGAGVPSTEIAQKYISDLGLKHIAFKPSSVKSIKQVINIAKANPSFPIILQWTGGRAGGHHSCEDFHTPILEVYGQIRDCENIILIAGSGFGSADDVYLYFTGAWSRAYGYPPMPFDGVLLGSRMMTAKEASTSLGAKKKIVETKGLQDSEWEKTFKGAAGGVITVISEMGEPMHVLATRGMRFWAEMDTIFKMPKAQRVAELDKKSSYIIRKLNDDFQKPWFGKNTAGKAVQLKEMTYYEILLRMLELMYISSHSLWVDGSLMTLTGQFARRVEERFVTHDGRFFLSNYASHDVLNPHAILEDFTRAYPDIVDHIITPLDVEFFLSLCLGPGKKPVPFVPILDENLEFYFKKDSLWQSENLWAVVDNDADRTQILHGPIAAQHSTRYDEPVKDILDGINKGLIASLLRDTGSEGFKNVLTKATERTPEAHWSDSEDSVSIIETPKSVVYEIVGSADDGLPSPISWFKMIAGDQYTWRHALFTSETIVSGTKRLTNPIRKICMPSLDLRVVVAHPNEPSKMVITIQAALEVDQTGTIVEIRLDESGNIVVGCIFSSTALGQAQSTLRLAFSYHPEALYAPIRELQDGLVNEVSQFYRSLWFGDEQLDFDALFTQEFSGGTMTIAREQISSFLQATGSSAETYLSYTNERLPAPLDFSIVVAWKALLKPIFLKQIGGNILNLVHLSNSFKRIVDTNVLEAGDIVSTSSRITAVRIQDAGKVVEVLATITKDGRPVIEVTSQFMYRGKYTDFDTTFERKVEVPMRVHLSSRKDVEILKSKPWFHPIDPSVVLLDKTLTFKLDTKRYYSSIGSSSTVLVTGTITEKQAMHGEILIAAITNTTALSSHNPILRYLIRHGSEVDGLVSLEKAIPIHGVSGIALKRPVTSAAYAKVSKDFNPIHVSNTFALLAGLPGVIVHGMHTSSAIGSLLETWTANGRTGAVRSFSASFVGMIISDDLVEVEFWHTAMRKGRKVIKVTAKKVNGGEIVLKGEAEVEQPKTAYLFTGQGSQEQNMGMDLYATSAVARSVWDVADKYWLEHYGKCAISVEAMTIKRFPRSRDINDRQRESKRIHRSLWWR